MRWRKLGRIFDPTEHALPQGCESFAQSPQALVFDEFVRIYFSTRARDAAGKFLSHVAFVDMSKDFRSVIRVSTHTVMPLGELGSFDEHGIFPISPVQVGSSVFAYTCGWSRRVSVSVETGVGLAISHDEGWTFHRHGAGPILSASLHEPCLVGDAFVRKVGDQFRMWYIFGRGWKRFDLGTAPDRIYKIGHAVSADGVRWQKHEGVSIIPDTLGPDECQALPSVISLNGCHHMFFCFREPSDFRVNAARGYRIGHAWSRDLEHWHRDDSDPLWPASAGEWDSQMQCYPHVFECDGRVLLLYNGNEFGRRGFGLAELQR